VETSQNHLENPQQHNRQTRNQGTTEHSHIEHCTHTAGSTNSEVQNIQHERENHPCHTIVSTVYTLEKRFVLGT